MKICMLYFFISSGIMYSAMLRIVFIVYNASKLSLVSKNMNQV